MSEAPDWAEGLTADEVCARTLRGVAEQKKRWPEVIHLANVLVIERQKNHLSQRIDAAYQARRGRMGQ